MSSLKLLELFFKSKAIECIYTKSTNFAYLKGIILSWWHFIIYNHLLWFFYLVYTLNTVSIYIGTKKRIRIISVFSVTKNIFGDCKEHLQLSNSLGPNDQLVKVQPLFYSLNGQFLMNYQASCHACSQSLQHISIDKLMLSQSGRHGEKGCIRKKSIQFSEKF